MKLTKAILIGNTVVPAGAELIFDKSGTAKYNDTIVDIAQIPEDAIQPICSVEAIALKTKGQLAVDMLINVLITIFASCPPEDRNNLRKVLTNARQASTTSTPSATFKKLMKIDK